MSPPDSHLPESFPASYPEEEPSSPEEALSSLESRITKAPVPTAANLHAALQGNASLLVSQLNEGGRTRFVLTPRALGEQKGMILQNLRTISGLSDHQITFDSGRILLKTPDGKETEILLMHPRAPASYQLLVSNLIQSTWGTQKSIEELTGLQLLPGDPPTTFVSSLPLATLLGRLTGEGGLLEGRAFQRTPEGTILFLRGGQKEGVIVTSDWARAQGTTIEEIIDQARASLPLSWKPILFLNEHYETAERDGITYFVSRDGAIIYLSSEETHHEAKRFMEDNDDVLPPPVVRHVLQILIDKRFTADRRKKYRDDLSHIQHLIDTYDGSPERYRAILSAIHTLQSFLEAYRIPGESFPDFEAALGKELAPGEGLQTTTNLEDLLREKTDESPLRGTPKNLEEYTTQNHIIHRSIDNVIVPTDSKPPEVGEGIGGFKIGDFEDRLTPLFRGLRALEIEKSDVLILWGKNDPHMLRQQPYCIVEIPRLHCQILVCNQVGEATFMSTKILPIEVYLTKTKEELQRPPFNLTKVVRHDFTQWIEEIITIIQKDNRIADPPIDMEEYLEEQESSNTSLQKVRLTLAMLTRDFILGIQNQLPNRSIKDTSTGSQYPITLRVGGKEQTIDFQRFLMRIQHILGGKKTVTYVQARAFLVSMLEEGMTFEEAKEKALMVPKSAPRVTLPLTMITRGFIQTIQNRLPTKSIKDTSTDSRCPAVILYEGEREETIITFNAFLQRIKTLLGGKKSVTLIQARAFLVSMLEEGMTFEEAKEKSLMIPKSAPKIRLTPRMITKDFIQAIQNQLPTKSIKDTMTGHLYPITIREGEKEETITFRNFLERIQNLLGGQKNVTLPQARIFLVEMLKEGMTFEEATENTFTILENARKIRFIPEMITKDFIQTIQNQLPTKSIKDTSSQYQYPITLRVAGKEETIAFTVFLKRIQNLLGGPKNVTAPQARAFLVEMLKEGMTFEEAKTIVLGK